MIVRLLLLFLLVPLAELGLLIWMGDSLGLPATIVIMLVSGVLGAFLARRQGAATWRRFREALGRGSLPGEELVDGLLVLVSAAVLLAPGVLTDLAGLSLMLPPVRRPVGRFLTRYLQRRLATGLKARGATVPPRMDPDAVEVDYRVVDSPESEAQEEPPSANRSLPSDGTP